MLVISQPLSSVWSLDKIPKKTIKLLVGKKIKIKIKKLQMKLSMRKQWFTKNMPEPARLTLCWDCAGPWSSSKL